MTGKQRNEDDSPVYAIAHRVDGRIFHKAYVRIQVYEIPLCRWDGG